jgi:hypothetical protein
VVAVVSDLSSTRAFTSGMGTLSGYTEERLKQLMKKTAWGQVRENFGGMKPHRLIRGIAISSRRRNAHGNAYLAHGVQVTVPMLLLLNHIHTFPRGEVTSVDIRGDEVHFSAKLCNRSAPGPYWIEDAWQGLLSYELRCASIGGIRVLSPSYKNGKGAFARWTLVRLASWRWVRTSALASVKFGSVHPRSTSMVDRLRPCTGASR